MLINDLPLKRDEIDAVRLPVTQAYTLPPVCYHSPKWHEDEVRAIFLREWVCIGRVEQVGEPGDFFTLDFVGEPLIVVRTERNEIKVHLNTCRHRGAVVAEGSGHVQSFRCPYHSWIYALDGELKATPGREKPMDDPIENFCKADWGLQSVRAETWAGFIFVCFDESTMPLATWLGDLPKILERYKLDDMIRTHSTQMTVQANWKSQVENFLEGYHIATVHTKHLSSETPQKWTLLDSGGPYLGNDLRNSVSNVGKFPEIAGLTDDELNSVRHMWLVPNVKLSVAPTYMKYFLMFPDGPGKHTLVANWCFPRTTAARPDFEEIAGPNYYGRGTIKKIDGEWVDEIVLEDNAALEKVQVGLSSRYAKSGRFAKSETNVHAVANYVLSQVGVADRPSDFGPRIPEGAKIRSNGNAAATP